MSKSKNKEILESINQTNYLNYNKDGIINAMLKLEVAGQRVFYVYLNQKGISGITPENMDKNQSDGIIGNTIIECKLNENEGGGLKKAYQELYSIIPNRLKNKGEKLPYYRIYVELETFLVEVYDCHCQLKETFDWFENPEKFKKYFSDKKNTFEYDLNDEDVDLVEVIQNIYKVFPIKEKMEAYKKLNEGSIGWFKPFDLKSVNINRLILNNDKMNEKYVENAISQIEKDGYDNYVIVDRCAGVGNLESQFKEEIYSHLILGTINEAEAFTANIRFGGLANVFLIDALSENGINHYINKIKEYKIKNNVKKLAVIFLENPPYRNVSGNVHEKRTKNIKEVDFVWSNMSLDKKNFRNQNISSVRDTCNRFIWSAYEYYNPTHYILFSPVGFWKSVGLIDKEFYNGYVCNREYFNATEAAILLSHWGNNNYKNKNLKCKSENGNIIISPISSTVSKYTKNYNKEENNPYGYIITTQGTPDFKHGGLISKKDYKSNIRGIFSITEKEVLNQCPLFVANCYEPLDYREKENIMKSSDGGEKYKKDIDFLQNSLLYTLCTNKNKAESDSDLFNLIEIKLNKDIKKEKIYLLYMELVSKTGLNGLYNIEKYNKLKFGKLWKIHELNPKIKELKVLVKEFYLNNLRDKLFKYELLK